MPKYEYLPLTLKEVSHPVWNHEMMSVLFNAMQQDPSEIFMEKNASRVGFYIFKYPSDSAVYRGGLELLMSHPEFFGISIGNKSELVIKFMYDNRK